MDAKKLEEIKAAHEAEGNVEPGGAALFAWAKKVHEHRGLLLDAIAEAQAAEKVHPALAVGMRVIAKHDPTIDERLAVETGRARERCDGHGGRIELKMADGWQVDHGDYGRAWWTSAELTPDTAGHPTLRVEATAPLPPSVRLWTEEQIREAWDQAGAKWSCGVTWETLSRELRGEP